MRLTQRFGIKSHKRGVIAIRYPQKQKRNQEAVRDFFKKRYGASGRITRLRLALRVVAKATLSSLELNLSLQLHSITAFAVIKERYGASGRIRTSDRSVRSRVLYPAELRMHWETCFTADIDTAAKAVSSKRYGASGRIRTSDRSVRSRVLYPAELRMQNGGEAGIRTPDAAFDRILP